MKIRKKIYHGVSMYNVPDFTFYILKLPMYIYHYIRCWLLKKPFVYHDIVGVLNLLRVECANYDKIDDRGKHSLKCSYWYDDNCIYVKLRFYRKADESEYESFRNSVDIHCDYGISNLSKKNGCFYFVICMRIDPIYDFQMDNYRMTVGTSYKGLHYWDYSKYPHALIVGETGQGKSVLVRYLLKNIFSNNFDVWCVDGKKIDYPKVKNLFKRYVANDNDKIQIMGLLRSFKDEMQSRYDYMLSQGIYNYYEDNGLKPVFLLIDEYLEIVKTAQKKELVEIEKMISEIILLGRAAGYFLIMTMQRADAKYIDGAIRDNFACRIVVGKASKESYAMLFNQNVKGFDIGKAWLQINNELEMISIPYYNDF